MAEAASDVNSEPEHGIKKLKEHVIQHKIDFILWVLRVFTILFTIGYFIPLFWKPHTLYFKALLCHVGISALRLHQRLPQISFTRQFLHEFLMEDSFHYLLYAIIFFSIHPVTIILQPIFLFSLLHAASYSLTLLDTLGHNSWWGARFLIAIVELQSGNILRLVSFTEIFLMPCTVIFIFLGRANILTPIVYYHFLCLRYMSRRNPYTRNVCHELRLILENMANKPGTPPFLRQIIHSIVSITCRLGPVTEVAYQGYRMFYKFIELYSENYSMNK